jgi:hypothetical protein
MYATAVIIILSIVVFALVVAVIVFAFRAMKYYDLYDRQCKQTETALDEIESEYKKMFFEAKHSEILVNDPVVMDFILRMKNVRNIILKISRLLVDQDEE